MVSYRYAHINVWCNVIFYNVVDTKSSFPNIFDSSILDWWDAFGIWKQHLHPQIRPSRFVDPDVASCKVLPLSHVMKSWYHVFNALNKWCKLLMMKWWMNNNAPGHNNNLYVHLKHMKNNHDRISLFLCRLCT